MSSFSETGPFGFSNLLQLKAVLSDFSIAENALKENDSVILADEGSWKYVLMTMNEYECYLRLKTEEENRSINKQLPTLINGIGKRFFIEYYLQLKEKKVSILNLSLEQKWSTSSLNSRISRANTIFGKGWQIDALRHIIESPNSDQMTRDRAQILLNKELDIDDGIHEVVTHAQVASLDWGVVDKSDIPLEKLDNKSFAFKCFDLLIGSGVLFDKDLEMLTDKDHCKDKFNCSGFPILSEVSLEEELVESDYNRGGKQRFYKSKIIIGNRAFLISNHWYGPNKSMPDNRTPFQTWVTEKVNS